MCDDQKHLALRRKASCQGADLFHAFQIQSAGRLIEHQQLLAADIAHHDRKALHLPAGKRQGMPFLIRQQIHLF